MQFLTKLKYLLALLVAVGVSFSVLNGCDDSGNVITPKSDSGVVHFDSIGVTDGIGNVLNSINLYNGTTVERDSASKDANLVDSIGTGFNFMLRSGNAVDLFSMVQGFETRFNRIYASMTQTEFDSITVIPSGELDPSDFTSDDTYGGGAWGYFNAPMTTSDPRPVYSFWLKGKSADFLGRNVYGILIPREATVDINGVFRMSFEVRINTLGYNYFLHSEH